MPKVSIVVPVYKTEKYLQRCVDSILVQTLTDIEIILVDDGSPDNCPSLCDEIASKESRVRVVHKTNGGLSSARNAGIEVATGKYIGFVDSDDTINENMYASLLEIIERENVDFVMSDYNRILDNGESYIKTLDIRAGRYCKEDIKNEIFPNLIMGKNIDYGPLLSVCHCLYSLDFLNKYNLRFDENVRWSEDNIFSAILGYHADSFYYEKGLETYNYFQNAGTITTSYRKGAWEVYCTMNEKLHSYFDDISDYDFSNQLKLHMIYYACNCIGMAKSLSKQEAKNDIQAILKSNELKSALKNVNLSGVPFKLKVKLYLMKYRFSSLVYHLH